MMRLLQVVFLLAKLRFEDGFVQVYYEISGYKGVPLKIEPDPKVDCVHCLIL